MLRRLYLLEFNILDVFAFECLAQKVLSRANSQGEFIWFFGFSFAHGFLRPI